jgi:hypothetical protein
MPRPIRLILVYEIMQIINKNYTSLRVDRPRRKSDEGRSSTRLGKGQGVERFERGAKLKGLSPRE